MEILFKLTPIVKTTHSIKKITKNGAACTNFSSRDLELISWETFLQMRLINY